MSAICVYCASGPVDKNYLELAAQTGAAIAGAGHTLVSGGGSVGMMGALVRGARAAGGYTIGIIPEHLMRAEVADTDSDELIVTDTMRERKRLMDELSEGFIILPGGIGTLEELFETWTGGFLGVHSKPMALVNYDDFYTPILAWLADLTTRGFVARHAVDRLQVVGDVGAALAIADSTVR
ncbi:MAG: TIGR00730 family Rossman fold protein [Gordonia sp. (in: high G+C Gram-positive bacteria)]|uniref:LOG family protein n=1 Tax=Gordonia sp. (in: high G+C Gram-positive bacteria) TaxID=84139 RepID=UPI003BB77B57